MIILRPILRILLGLVRLLLTLGRKTVKLTLLGAAAGALLMALDALLLDSEEDRR
ncbi:MAG: hypothetical protein ABIP13_11110 [Tepidiformaceae bacterium]